MTTTITAPAVPLLPTPHRESSGGAVWATWTVAGVAAAILLLAALFLGHGGKWFVIETPSMGESAPVGTLVLDLPVKTSDLHVGEIVTYRPPTEPSVTFTHRIVRIDADGGIHTRGDANGATDPWTLTPSEIVGTPLLVVPGVGWILRAMPILILGMVTVGALTGPIRDRTTRSSLRISGASLVVSAAAYVLKPFVHVETIADTTTRHGVHVTLISSGLFPIRVSTPGGTSARLVDGQTGHLVVTELSKSGHFQLASSIDLSPTGWVALGLVCAVPLVWCLVVGRIRMVLP